MQRFKTRLQFQAALAGSLVAKSMHFAVHEVASTPSSPPLLSLFPTKTLWIGAMAPKRWAKRAVTRNTIKRQIYTVSTGLNDFSSPAAFLIRLRREFSRPMFPSATSCELKSAVRAELLGLLQTVHETLKKRELVA